jgi:peptidyl-prolyl cis-trans isomerase C
MSDDAYLTLKLAGELYKKSPGALASNERKRVDEVAARQRQIEKRILTTPEAAQVVLSPSAIEQSVAAIRARYTGSDEFLTDLAANGLDEAQLRRAIGQDLVVEAVLESVASRAGAVDDTEIEIFYLMHRQRFRKPETRALRHILVTINDMVPGSERGAALAKIEGIRARVAGSAKRFEQEVLKHSECPTAMNGGVLGRMPRGQLFPELEAAAFALRVGESSQVLESPIGFHILRCDSIDPERQMELDQVRDSIRSQLAETRRSKAQKAWIAGLFRAG